MEADRGKEREGGREGGHWRGWNANADRRSEEQAETNKTVNDKTIQSYDLRLTLDLYLNPRE